MSTVTTQLVVLDLTVNLWLAAIFLVLIHILVHLKRR